MENEKAKLPEAEQLPTLTAPVDISTGISTAGGLIPHNLNELWQLSTIMSRSGMMPKGIQTPQAVCVAVQMGLEVGLSPMQAVQNIAVINGRPSLWGDAVLGLVRASGLLEDFDETFEGEGDKIKAVCTAKRKDQEAPIIREFSVEDAKVAGLWKNHSDSPWTKYPKRMLQMRARSWCLRDGFGDVIKGLHVAEEVIDMVEIPSVQADQEKAAEITKDLKNGAPPPEGATVYEAEDVTTPDQESGQEETGDPKPDDLFTKLQGMRPGTSAKNLGVFKDMLQKHWEEIKGMPQEKQGYLEAKWKKATDKPWPWAEKVEGEAPMTATEILQNQSADNSDSIARMEFYEKARQAKAIFADNGKIGLYINVLKEFNCEIMNDVPPEKEGKIIKALHAAIDKMNEETEPT